MTMNSSNTSIIPQFTIGKNSQTSKKARATQYLCNMHELTNPPPLSSFD